MPPEPTLSDVHADLVGRLQQDERLRAVEQQTAAMAVVVSEIPRMEARLTAAIQDVRPKNTWAAAGVIVAAIAVVVTVFALALQR